MADNTCISCGEIIPEGMIACPNCLVVSKQQAAENKWISVREMYPRLESYVYSVDVLFHDYEEGIHVGYVNFRTGAWKDKYSRDLYAEHKVTHWMHLPEPPKEEE